MSKEPLPIRATNAAIKAIDAVMENLEKRKFGLMYYDGMKKETMRQEWITLVVRSIMNEFRAYDDSTLLRDALKHAKIFIEYARYCLEDGKAVIGSQFPHKDDADVEIKRIEDALKGRRTDVPM
jgi:hypothetical protein